MKIRCFSNQIVHLHRYVKALDLFYFKGVELPSVPEHELTNVDDQLPDVPAQEPGNLQTSAIRVT